LKELTKQQRFAFEAFIGHIVLERRERALAKGEETIPIGDIGDSRELMERAFVEGWEWADSLQEEARRRAEK
jgi:hypothetical protein